jgi:hypothetical protein
MAAVRPLGCQIRCIATMHVRFYAEDSAVGSCQQAGEIELSHVTFACLSTVQRKGPLPFNQNTRLQRLPLSTLTARCITNEGKRMTSPMSRPTLFSID